MSREYLLRSANKKGKNRTTLLLPQKSGRFIREMVGALLNSYRWGKLKRTSV